MAQRSATRHDAAGLACAGILARKIGHVHIGTVPFRERVCVYAFHTWSQGVFFTTQMRDLENIWVRCRGDPVPFARARF